MDFFTSSKAKKDSKKSSGLFGKKTVSKSTPGSPAHPPGARSPPPSYLSNKRAETEYDFPMSNEQRPYWKQPASERVPNSHPRPPVYGYGTSDHRRDHGRERMEAMSYEPETNAPSSPYHPAGNRTPERPRKSTEYRREHQDRMYEADTRSNASPFHPFRSPSPSPFHTPDRRRDHYDMYEPEANTMLQNSAPGSPFHPAGSRSPPPYRTPDRRSNYGKEQFEDLYEQDGDVTPRNSSPPSPFHPAAYKTSDQRSNHGKEQIEDFYEQDDDVTPRNSSPPSPLHPAASHSPPPPQPYRTPDHRRSHQDNEDFEAMYELDGDLIHQKSAPPSPVHGPYYSSSDDDNHSTYLYPEIRSPLRSRIVSENSTPVHHNYQIVAAETYEQDKQFEPPELPDESQSFTMQEITKMRGLKNYESGKEESQSMISEAYVSVANYRVRQSVSETLQAIIDKHGDIAASSKLQAMATRSYYLESLAAVVMELKKTVLRDLTKTRVAEIAAVVKDMESVKINVSWLKTAVTELAEAVEYFGQYDTAKVEKEVCERDLTAKKGEMEEMTTELVKREKEIKECREKVTVVAGRLGQLEMKGSKLNKNLDLFQSKVHKFQGEAVLLHL
ncbi:putative phospholipase, SCC2/Nipped-B family [Arabidopsis thaliana]|uniref:Phospholipase-like protein (PEARLI 4) family protein n=3 Tax=Arabidopsis TaxID=3701 RepID=A0A178UTJ3_ARATH|nr:Phospholipase-like [Arabidopsis thaliana x Arabidopsis arenosa]OAO97239.1 hypothetical protein AXX17_AT4G43890 [Arabidopsis thaliana]